MNVRPAVADDARAIARVHVASWNAAYRGVIADEALDALTEDALAPEWRAEIERPEGSGVIVTVVEQDGALAGYARYGPARDDDLDPARHGEVYGFYLHPDHWGRGAGRALMEHVRADLRGRGFELATLWVVQANDRAQAFYRGVGFEPDGRADKPCIGAPQFRYRAWLAAVRPGGSPRRPLL